MVFLPSASVEAVHERQTWLLVHAKGLVARRVDERIVLPTAEEVAALGLGTSDAHHLGSWENTDAFVVPFTGPVDAPFELLGLRMLAALLDGETIDLAVVIGGYSTRICSIPAL